MTTIAWLALIAVAISAVAVVLGIGRAAASDDEIPF